MQYKRQLTYQDTSSLFQLCNYSWPLWCIYNISRRYFLFTSDFQVRLTGGSAPNAGRVEVRYLGVWGSIVHVLSLYKFGAVVCRQLGYTRVSSVLRDAASLYGRGIGPVWMTHVQCEGNETSVGDCLYEREFHNRIPEVAIICHHNGKTTKYQASCCTEI